MHTLATVSYVTMFRSVRDTPILSIYHQKHLISFSVFSIINYMYAERRLDYFRFLRNKPTICGPEMSRHGRNSIFGTFWGHCVKK